ncbi:hypothetical protein KEM60_02735 [Austwickia sp. TVS 96-490-7B]|uniref:hypothetical protein n=1 Tax=Austwickia sp. TVS 96-490-7B TaxID=2830843 RepID=UPI001C59BE0F|nr:hypothetical protein [Austwickia sp. TVS 96-490-7B]MBW3086514.1 hypothetical protein [Austwickia sp. TVS 96-490-7B]
MKHRRPTPRFQSGRLPAIAALAVAAISGTALPASAAETSPGESPTSSAPGQATADPSATDQQNLIEKISAEYLAKTHGLSQEDALVRVREQPYHAANARDVARILGSRYTGSYIDQKRGKLVVNVADEDAARQINHHRIETRIVGAKADDLATTRKKAEEKLGAKLQSSYVDQTRGLIVLKVSAGDLDEAKKMLADLKNLDIQPGENVIIAH